VYSQEASIYNSIYDLRRRIRWTRRRRRFYPV
jgi:hypothetical protein